MHFARKLQKAFSLDSVRSIVEHARRRLHPVDTRAMFARLDPPVWADLQRRYDGAQAGDETRNSDKFSDANYWIKVNVERAQDLGLDRAQPLRILDLGCGAGYFLFVNQCLGHEVLGLDVDDVPLYRETTALLGVQRVISRIEPMTPLPELGERFDLITAHCICFQKIRPLGNEEWAQWGGPEWSFFIDDVRSRLLKPTGRLLLDFNPRRRSHFYPPEAEAVFRAEGAKIFRSKVLLPALAPVHPAAPAAASA